MGASVFSQPRISVDGKFFRLGREKFPARGITYGPLPPNANGFLFASPEQTAADFALIRELGANVVRIYQPPMRWLLDIAAEHGLKLLVDIPWSKHLCFLDSPVERQAAHNAVRRAVGNCGGHPAVFAFSVANEIPADIVRWSGARAVEDFLDALIETAKATDPDCLCTFGNFPPTEFLRPRNPDFVCFNVYLHERAAFENYLARLQSLAGEKPLVLGEFGIDSLREGESRQGEILAWQIESAFRNGLAGATVFSFTDDWFKDGRKVEGWGMGLTTRQREPKPAFAAVQKQFAAAPHFPLPRTPRVSVIVAGYNGDRTLKACLDSLARLHYPDCEIILVDDGSTDTTRQIAAQFPGVQYIRHERNFGLSVARNTGLFAASGEIVAFTDSDCRADEDWLYHLVGDLLRREFVGMGGHNLLPPEDSFVAASVMASPGGPAHVMLTDHEAEHIPGCNMAFFKYALMAVNGFDPVFRRAGDDVDICWRLQQAGYKIGFNPAGFVWHYRRSTVRDYLKQQQGYGEAEALLAQKHPENFNSFGGGMWRGRIYGPAGGGVTLTRPVIYRGPFGTGFFQTLYAGGTPFPLLFFTSLEFHLLVTLPLWVLAATFHQLRPLALTSLLVSAGVCLAAAAQVELPPSRCRVWSRPLVALLYYLQPIVRGWARYRGRLSARILPKAAQPSLDSVAVRDRREPLDETVYRPKQPVSRVEFLRAVLERLVREGWPHHSDAGWSNHDVEVHGGRWTRLQLTTVTEEHPQTIRCRLRARWSLPARAAFWTLLGVDVLIIGMFGSTHGWVWLLLLALPAFQWWLARQKRDLQSRFHVWLDGVAGPLGMARLNPGPQPHNPRVAALKFKL